MRACLALALLAPAATADAGLDLRAVRPAGVAGSDTAEIAGAGDVNGDGVQDLAVGLQGDRRVRGPASLEAVAVVGFGGTPPDPARAGFAGIVVSHVNEPVPDERFGQGFAGDVAGVGDWNGDGLDDVAFGAVGASPRGRPNAGSVYVVLGRREGATIDARSDPGLVRIDGPERGSRIGATLGAAGDFDGDGRPDLVIALPGERAVVVRGGVAPGTAVDLARPPAGATIELRGLDAGEPISEPEPGRAADAEATSFAAAGDVDGDGRGELVVGLPAAARLHGGGRVLVVRGAPAGSIVDAADRRTLVAHVVGPPLHNGFGESVGAAPDSDGDGLPEWLIGAAIPTDVWTIGGESANGAFLVFSRARGEVRAGEPGQPVVAIDARGFGDRAGRFVAGTPDVTGDGTPDLLIGLPDASPSCRAAAGAIALVAGRATPGRVRVGARSPRVDGPLVGAHIGESVALAGTDVLLGARPFANSARLHLWRVPLTAFTGSSPALPGSRACLSVTVQKRSRAQLRRTGLVRAVVRSDAGDGRAHRLAVRVEIVRGTTYATAPRRVIALPGAGERRLALRLGRRAGGLLGRRGSVTISVTVEQRVGSGIRTTPGAFSGDSIVFGRP